MADTFTTQLNLTKVGIGESEDTWGNKLNDNWDGVDGLFDAGPYLKVANGGTGAGTAATARTALGIGSIATQASDAVAITGGTATFSAATISGSFPWFYHRDTDLAVDASGLWAVGANAGAYNVVRNTAAGGDFATNEYVLSASPTSFLHMNSQVWTAATDGAGSGLDADLLDGQQGAYYQNASNLNAGSIPNARVPATAVTQHQASLVIAESQITDGSIFGRLSANEVVTGNWAFPAAGDISRAGHGKYTYLVGTGNTGGAITISSSGPSGTPVNGDIWIQYVP